MLRRKVVTFCFTIAIAVVIVLFGSAAKAAESDGSPAWKVDFNVFVAGGSSTYGRTAERPLKVRPGDEVCVQVFASKGVSNAPEIPKMSRTVEPNGVSRSFKIGNQTITLYGPDPWVSYCGVFAGEIGKADFLLLPNGKVLYMTYGDRLVEGAEADRKVEFSTWYNNELNQWRTFGTKANVGDSYTKPESDNRYQLKLQGRNTLAVGGGVTTQSVGSTTGGVNGYAGLRFADPTVETALFELGFYGAANFAGGEMSVRSVQGIPLTSPTSKQNTYTAAALALLSLQASRYVHFTLGGGPGWKFLHMDEATVGNDPLNQRQFFWPAQSEHAFVLVGQAGMRWQFMATSPSPGLLLTVRPVVDVTPTRVTDGGTNTANRVTGEFAAAIAMAF